MPSKSDDLTKRGPADASRINASEMHEVRYWSDKFGVTWEQLIEAVKRAGPSAEAVERHLKANE